MAIIIQNQFLNQLFHILKGTMQSFRGDIFNMKSQQLKFNAFFSYLRSFSEAGLDTLTKLQSEFHKQIKKKTSEKELLGIMKNILSSYQIFVLEMKDSCDFVQIPEFGFCIGKTFVQMLKIIKWFLRAWLKSSSKYQQIKAKMEEEESKNIDEAADPNAVCAFCQELIKNNPYGKLVKGKRKGVAINNINSEIRGARKQHQRQRSHLRQFQEQVIENYTSKQIKSRKYLGQMNEVDILNEKYASLKMEFSNKDNVLEEVLNQFNLKTEAIARFVNHSQILGLQDYKMCSDTNFDQIEQQIKQSISQKFQQAKSKLKLLVASKMQEYQKIKKSKLEDKQIQTVHYQTFQKQKWQSKVKHLNVALRQMKNELDSTKALNQSLKKLLESKSIQFQEEFLKYRRNHLLHKAQVGSRDYLRSLKSLKDILEENQDGMENLDNNTSINKLNEQSNDNVRRIKKKSTNGIFKEKRGMKKQMSIKFTLQNQGASDDDKTCSIKEESIKSKSCIDQSQLSFVDVTQVSTQTESAWSPQFIQSAGNTPLDKKFILIDRKNQMSRFKRPQFSRIKKSGSKGFHSKHSSKDLYSHVKSKVYDKIQTPRTPSGTGTVQRYSKTNTSSSEFYSLVKQLSVSYGTQDFKQSTRQLVICHKIDKQPIFSYISSIDFNMDDIFNLFVSIKNAENYQCLLYRNAIFSNVNPKRAINYKRRMDASEIDWSFRKEYDQAQDTENKISAIIYHHLTHLRKKQRVCYEQIKYLLRSPTEICINTEVISLQKNHEERSKDIDHSQLKKMMNIILKFHSKCTNQEKNVICGHLVQFCRKIGIKFE